MKERDWNDAIGQWFFGGSSSGRPVYLSLDDEVLADIALASGWELDDPSADFESAIRAIVAPFPASPFQIWSGSAMGWSRRSDRSEFPPMLALLGATVLAGFRRGGGKHQGFHAQLQRVLGLPITATEIADYRNDVPPLWQVLRRWLEAENGRRGLPTAEASAHWPYIGWSMSQALLRAHDRSRLQDFFAHIGYEPRSEVSPSEILTRFTSWAKVGDRVTPRLLATVHHPSEGPVLAELIANELRSWDGAVRDERGRKIIRVDLQLDERTRRVGYVAIVPEGVPAHDLPVGGHIISLPKGPAQVRLPLDVSQLCPTRSWRVTSPAATLRWEPQAVMVFRPNEDVGGWVSARRGVLGESHYVLAMEFVAPKVERFLREHVPQGWLETKKIHLPGGLRLFKHVVLEKSYADVEPVLLPLLPRAQQIPELVGGLRVAGRRHAYLREGPPDILVPGWEDDALPVTLDGELIAEVDRSGLLYPLVGLDLSTGRHEVRVGSTKLPFQLVDEQVDLPAPPLLVHGLDRIGEGFLPTGPVSPVDEVGGVDVRLSGAAVYTADEPLLRAAVRSRMIKTASRGYIVFGPTGCSARVDPAQPRWAAEIGLDFNAFEVESIERRVGFPISWVARMFRHHAVVIDVRVPDGRSARANLDPLRWQADVAEVVGMQRVELASGSAPDWESYVSRKGE